MKLFYLIMLGIFFGCLAVAIDYYFIPGGVY